jgi:predicted AAA+ superfamily ATPase
VGEKYFFEDVGLRNAILGYKIQDIEKIIENLVFLHLKNSGYKVFVGVLRNKEIGFIAEKENERIYIQLACLLSEPQTIEREFGNLLLIKDNYPTYVISYDAFESPNTLNGIHHLKLIDFLKNFK